MTQPAANSLFPMFLKLHGRTALVVGAGQIAKSKIESLLLAGAQVCVVAPYASAPVIEWATTAKIELRSRCFQPDDLDDVYLVIAATSLADLNHQVAEEAGRRGVLCNVVDDPEFCDFFFPAVLRRGALQIAVSTAGQCPSLSQLIRDALEDQFDADYGARLRQLGELRRAAVSFLPMGWRRSKLLRELAERTLISGDHDLFEGAADA